MPKIFFITATNTDMGKTFITQGLLKLFHKNKLRTLGLKPLASGCDETPDGRRNQDALLLQEHSSLKLPYDDHNFFALSKPIAPHLAAESENISLNVNLLKEKTCAILDKHQNNVDVVLIEGIGGWLVPLNASETMADFVKCLDCEVILVVGMTLGCLNHALLTIEAMQNQSISLSGWIANNIDPKMEFIPENIDYLKQKISAPLLGIVPFGENPENAIHLNLIKP